MSKPGPFIVSNDLSYKRGCITYQTNSFPLQVEFKPLIWKVYVIGVRKYTNAYVTSHKMYCTGTQILWNWNIYHCLNDIIGILQWFFFTSIVVNNSSVNNICQWLKANTLEQTSSWMFEILWSPY